MCCISNSSSEFQWVLVICKVEGNYWFVDRKWQATSVILSKNWIADVKFYTLFPSSSCLIMGKNENNIIFHCGD